MIFTVETIIEVHKRVIATSGVSEGIKDIALIDSAVSLIHKHMIQKNFIQR